MSQDIKELVKGLQNFRLLNDDELRAFEEALRKESARRTFLRNGLDLGEQLRFDETVDLIRERTGLEDEDALAMIRAHVPYAPKLRRRCKPPEGT